MDGFGVWDHRAVMLSGVFPGDGFFPGARVESGRGTRDTRYLRGSGGSLVWILRGPAFTQSSVAGDDCPSGGPPERLHSADWTRGSWRAVVRSVFGSFCLSSERQTVSAADADGSGLRGGE